MATVLLVEDFPDLGLYESRVLQRKGHRVLECNGAPSVFGACPMLKGGSCALADAADIILISLPLSGAVHHRPYDGSHVLSAYRMHRAYGTKPMLVVSGAAPGRIGGPGRCEVVMKQAPPHAIVEAVERLLGAARGTATAGVAV
jgi:hypothetical protein